ncbi:polysaccharide ABC transporter ATP-binding protein [Hymenobacter sp. BT491]|uniref:ABC transporter ATP-binding protein n=1 Tax=Hymenobacter sp. BT491 TaxID=2766779 RepID=UPI0016536EE7|nr:ABC transporter ATP-binding protein [Hymenobacter sp. BT491]MBC6988286.1 ATP-binding cassette domain-containing protein [Hymenobacter sp. BT491]
MSDVAIKVENLGKLYRLGEIGTGTLSQDLNRAWARMRGKEDPFAIIGEVNDRTRKGNSDFVWSLKDISFEAKKGEILGIIGRNGAGKSTLLKILSKVTAPTTGTIKVQGRIASLLEVGTGFHPDLTGRENVFLNGAILGMNKAEIRGKFDEIVDFSGVERYIDTPVKRYSSGMYVRLAFAVAAFLEPEILIIDEVLAVGDAEFQKKCLGRMKDVSVNDGRTVLFVSHDLNAVAQLCTHGIILQNGYVAHDGRASEVIPLYLNQGKESSIYINKADYQDKSMAIKSVKIKDVNDEIASNFMYDENIVVEFDIFIKDKSVKADLFVMVLDSRKKRVFSSETSNIKEHMKLIIDSNFLVRGDYSIHAFINQPKIAQLDVVEDVCNFKILDSGSDLAKHGEYDYGSVFGRYSWA